MNHIIKPKRTSSAGVVPTTSNLEEGEIAINLVDKKLFVRDTSNNILELTTRTLGSLDDIYLSGETDAQPLHYNSSSNRWENYNRDLGPWSTSSGNTYYNVGSAYTAVGKSTHSGTYTLEVEGGFNANGQITLASGKKVGPGWFNESASLVTESYDIPCTYNAEASTDTAIAVDVVVKVCTGSVFKVSDLSTSD
mgnify:FL=1|jgi:hypothetical protein